MIRSGGGIRVAEAPGRYWVQGQ